MAGERFSLDTNILVYAVDHRDAAKHFAARAIIEAAVDRDCWLTVQTLTEFYAVTTRKVGLNAARAAGLIGDWVGVFPRADRNWSAVAVALDAAVAGRFGFWDALLLATAEQAGCTVLLSEDMADGARLGNIVVRAPFAADDLSPAARAVLDVEGA